MRFSVDEISQAVSGKVCSMGADSFGGMSTDTRKVKAGDLFVALVGETFDGHRFVEQAFERGAVGAVVSQDVPDAEGKTIIRVGDTLLAYQNIARLYRERFDRPFVAITGSNGKTTTKDMVASVLEHRCAICKTQANFNNEIGLPFTLLSMKEDDEAAVVEMGMRGLGQIAQLTRIAHPTIGVVTNVGETHMEILGSIDNIALAKSELPKSLPARGIAILNGDDERVRKMADVTRAQVVLFGIDGDGLDVRAKDITKCAGGTSFVCCIADGEKEMMVPAFGRHNVQNALAAVAVGRALGMTLDDIAEGLTSFVPSGMRFAVQRVGDYTFINDAYNASPRSTAGAIDNLADITDGRKIVVFGDMLELGDITEDAHRGIGRKCAEKGVDAIFTYGSLACLAADEAKACGVPAAVACDSHEEIAEYLNTYLQAGDTVLVKGSRGMKMETVIKLIASEGETNHD